MKFEDKITSMKHQIAQKFANIPLIKRPGIVIIVNTEDEKCVNCTNLIVRDCEDMTLNYYKIEINSNIDRELLYNTIDKYTSMEEVDLVIILSPLPNQLDVFEKVLELMQEHENYNKLLYTKVLFNEPLFTRLLILQMIMR